MLNIGDGETRLLADDWTVVTADGSLSAHFEHTVAITPDGHEILTARDGCRPLPWTGDRSAERRRGTSVTVPRLC